MSGVETKDRFLASLWGIISCASCCVYKLSIEGWLFFFCVAQFFSNVLENKDQLLSPDDNPRLAILSKRATVERKGSRASFIGEQSPTEFGVPSASDELEDLC